MLEKHGRGEEKKVREFFERVLSFFLSLSLPPLFFFLSLKKMRMNGFFLLPPGIDGDGLASKPLGIPYPSHKA